MYLARNDFWGKTFAISLLDLPFSISPVITGARQLGVPAGRLGPSCKGGAWQRGGPAGLPRSLRLCLPARGAASCHAEPGLA